MPWRSMKRLAKSLELSSCAAAFVGPKIARPSARKRSTTPAASGASGPTTVSATSWSFASFTRSATAVASTFSTPSSRAVPALPGATRTFETRGLRASFQASACSRPPEPMTRSFTAASSVPEVAHAGEDHGDAVPVGGGDHLLVAHAAARLDHGAGAGLRDHVQPVAEGEEGIRGRHRPRERESVVLRLDRGDARGVDPAHLAGAHAQRHATTTENNGVGFH